MAKQAVGPVVRYLDKAVLVVCGGAFLYVVAMYGVVSPIKVGPEGGEQFGPGDIDPQIKVEAERLREKLRDSPAPTPDPTGNNDIERLDLSGMDNLLAMAGIDGRIPSPVPPGLPVPQRSGDVEQRKINLVEVIDLPKPEVIVGRSGLYLQPPDKFEGGSRPKADNDSYLQDTNWATVYATFDRAEQERLYAAAGYSDEQAQATFLGLDLERRMQQPNGAWSDWSPINATRTMQQPELPQPQVYQADKGLFAVSDEDREDVDEFVALITDGDNNEAQCDLQRPLFASVAYGDTWEYPKLENADARALDAEIQTSSSCRYPECAGAGDVLDTSLPFDDLLEQAEDALKAKNFDKALRYAEAALKNAETESNDRDARKANRVIDDINKAVALEEQLSTRDARLPTQLLWAHDAGIGSLQSGRTYQYRARARLFNNYAAKPTLLVDAQQASIVEQVSDWSAPSDPVTIEPDTVIFAKSEKASKLEMKVEVYKWFAGQWFARQFTVTLGDPIGEPKNITTPRGKELVDFSTGATVVDMDFHKEVLLPGRRSNRLEQTSTTSLIYVDASGNLHENLLEFDKNSETYKRFKGMAWDE